MLKLIHNNSSQFEGLNCCVLLQLISRYATSILGFLWTLGDKLSATIKYHIYCFFLFDRANKSPFKVWWRFMTIKDICFCAMFHFDHCGMVKDINLVFLRDVIIPPILIIMQSSPSIMITIFKFHLPHHAKPHLTIHHHLLATFNA